MDIAKGIVGIKKIKADNKRGWHLIAENDSLGFFDETFMSITKAPEFANLRIIGVTGNGLYVENR